jgi:hypothetical protein
MPYEISANDVVKLYESASVNQNFQFSERRVKV